MAYNNNNELTIEQLRQKYRSEGYDALTDNQKIRLFLSYAEKGKNIDKAAETIINTYGNIYTAADSGANFLMNVCKLNISSAVLLSLIPVFSSICTFEKYSKLKLNSSENAKNFFHLLLKNNHFEKSAIIALNDKFNVINQLIFSNGETNKVNIPFRKIYEFAQNNNARYIIISHCHPNGSAIPSHDDKNTTLKIKELLSLTDVILVDHIIVSPDSALSMREYMDKDIFDDVNEYKTTVTTDEQ